MTWFVQPKKDLCPRCGRFDCPRWRMRGEWTTVPAMQAAEIDCAIAEDARRRERVATRPEPT